MTGGAGVRGIQRPVRPGLHSIHPASPAPTRSEIRTDFLGRAGLFLMLILACAGVAKADAAQFVWDRNGSTVVLEPYAPNIIRVTLSLDKDGALAAPGYGFVATPASAGWTHQQDEQADVYLSSRLVVKVAVNHP